MKKLSLAIAVVLLIPGCAGFGFMPPLGEPPTVNEYRDEI